MDVSIDRERALALACRVHQQFVRALEKDAAGLNPGQNLEATRIGLLRIRRLFPDDFNADLEAMIAAGNEAGKPP